MQRTSYSSRGFLVGRHLKEKVEVGPLKSNISHFKPYSLALTCRIDYSISIAKIISHGISSPI